MISAEYLLAELKLRTFPASMSSWSYAAKLSYIVKKMEALSELKGRPDTPVSLPQKSVRVIVPVVDRDDKVMHERKVAES